MRGLECRDASTTHSLFAAAPPPRRPIFLRSAFLWIPLFSFLVAAGNVLSVHRLSLDNPVWQLFSGSQALYGPLVATSAANISLACMNGTGCPSQVTQVRAGMHGACGLSRHWRNKAMGFVDPFAAQSVKDGVPILSHGRG